MESAGVALEEFLLSYQTLDITAMVLQIRRLEEICGHTDVASVAVIKEILSDCIRKASTTIRQKYAERINLLCSSCRKQLKAKVAKDTESSATHSTRHVAALLELIGCWSNIIAEIAELCFSQPSLLEACVAPYHERILGVAMECFTTFSEAKSLPSYLSRAGSSAVINIVTLDQLVSQLHAQLNIMWKYDAYLTSLQLSLPFLSQWKLAEMQYISLEQAYLQHATHQAVSEPPCLIEVEPNVLVMQCAEDVMVIVMYVYERIAVSPEHVVFVLMNSIIESVGHSSDVCRKFTDSSCMLPLIFDTLYPIIDTTEKLAHDDNDISATAPLLFSFAATVAENISTWTNASPPTSRNSNTSNENEVAAPREVDSVTLLVYYNTLMVLLTSVTKLRMRFGEECDIIAPQHASMITQELSGIEQYYEMYVTNEVSSHLSPLIEAITGTLAEVLSQEYIVDCDKMHDPEALANVGVDMMKQLTAIRSHASYDLSKLIIRLIGEGLNNYFLEHVVTIKCNEWGALTYNEEVMSVINLLEEYSLHHFEASVRPAFHDTILALTFLTLDRPADIVRYQLDTCNLEVEYIRNVMRCRTDFATEAIARVKIK